MAVMRFCTRHAMNYKDFCPMCDYKPPDFAYAVDETLKPVGRSANHEMDWQDVRKPLMDFAIEMDKKLRKNDHKTGWRELPIEAIKKLLYIELQELEVALEFLSVAEARKECVDAGNFVMILYDRLGMEEDKNNGRIK